MTLEGHEIPGMAFDAAMAYGRSDEPPKCHPFCPTCNYPMTYDFWVLKWICVYEGSHLSKERPKS